MMLLPTSDLVAELGNDADLMKVVKQSPVWMKSGSDYIDVHEVIFWVMCLFENADIPPVVHTALEFCTIKHILNTVHDINMEKEEDKIETASAGASNTVEANPTQQSACAKQNEVIPIGYSFQR